ncbi:unannotated protein [freshwater metagenome]|uniref:Unannotated protein n=1 Tax=freshwater metagenome TaxID=449393 RepID=A0A6J6FQW0_9ZZZZ
MQVTVEDAFDDGALHETNHPGTDDFVCVDSCLEHCVDIVEVETGKTLHHQYASGDECGVRARHDVAALFESNERCRNIEHVLRFEAEVEFLADRFGKELNECRWIGERSKRKAANKEWCKPGHHTNVFVDQQRHCGSLYFDHNGFACEQDGGVHLRD